MSVSGRGTISVVSRKRFFSTIVTHLRTSLPPDLARFTHRGDFNLMKPNGPYPPPRSHPMSWADPRYDHATLRILTHQEPPMPDNPQTGATAEQIKAAAERMYEGMQHRILYAKTEQDALDIPRAEIAAVAPYLVPPGARISSAAREAAIDRLIEWVDDGFYDHNFPSAAIDTIRNT